MMCFISPTNHCFIEQNNDKSSINISYISAINIALECHKLV